MRGSVTLMKSSALVGRARHALERMAADAAQHRVLLLIGAGEARQPFAVRHLCGEILGLAQLEIQFCRLLRRHLDRGRSVEVVADRADADRILPGFKLARREAVVALSVADDGDRDGGAGLLGAHQHAFHRAFLGRGDLSCQRCRRLSRCRRLGLCGEETGLQDSESKANERQKRFHAYRSFPKYVRLIRNRLIPARAFHSETPNGSIPVAPHPSLLGSLAFVVAIW